MASSSLSTRGMFTDGEPLKNTVDLSVIDGFVEEIEKVRDTELLPADEKAKKSRIRHSLRFLEPQFNPAVHFDLGMPDKRLTFQDLGLEKPSTAASDIAATTPFPILSPISIPYIRKALFNTTYIEKTAHWFQDNTVTIRNTAAYSPYFRRMTTDEVLLNHLSAIAGIRLEPVMQTLEAGHANVQVDRTQYIGLDTGEEIFFVALDMMEDKLMKVQPFSIGGGSIRTRSMEDIALAIAGDYSLVPWHFDSYPFVLVAMISDSRKMIGGETVIMKGNGQHVAVSQPGMGYGMLLQGGSVKHLALATSGGSGDRITIITSFRPAAVGLYDQSYLSNVRLYSDLDELYRQWIQYRLNKLLPGLQALKDRIAFTRVSDFQDSMDVKLEYKRLVDYARRSARNMVPMEHIAAVRECYELKTFFRVRMDYLQDNLFTDPNHWCKMCAGQPLNKKHLTTCPSIKFWRPDSRVWKDYHLRTLSPISVESAGEDMIARETIAVYAREQPRYWGILDELCAQNLIEYMIEVLDFMGAPLLGKKDSVPLNTAIVTPGTI